MCYLIPSAVRCPCVVPGESWRDGRPGHSWGPPGDPLGNVRFMGYHQGYPTRDSLEACPRGSPTISTRDHPGDPPGSRIPQGLGIPMDICQGVIHQSSTDETKILTMCYVIPSVYVRVGFSPRSKAQAVAWCHRPRQALPPLLT
jgi:hypothetical protein